MKTKKGFTLIELLVVIAIIALLLAILLPSLRAVKDQAKKVVCASHMKGMGTAVLLYVQENNDMVPPMNGGFANEHSTYYYVYRHVPTHASNNPGPSGLGRLWKAGYLEQGTELAFCPSMKSLFGAPMPTAKWNSNGDVNHWNYAGPGSVNNCGLLPEDAAMGWINLRLTIGMRNLGVHNIRRISTASIQGKRAFLSDVWAANPSTGYWWSTDEDVQHRSSNRRSMNVWYVDGHAENVQMDNSWFGVPNAEGKRPLHPSRTWANMFD